MLPSYLLSLREGIEAALIIGIVLGALRKSRRPDPAPSLWLGTIAAIAVSLLAAILLTLFGFELEGTTEVIYEGLTMLLAAGILTWMIFWMSQQARNLKPELEEGVNRAAAGGGSQCSAVLLPFEQLGVLRLVHRSLSRMPPIVQGAIPQPRGSRTGTGRECLPAGRWS